MNRSALTLAACLVLAVPAVAHSDDALDLAGLAADVVEIADAQDALEREVVRENDLIVNELDRHSALLDCMYMEATRFRRVVLADGSTAFVVTTVKGVAYPTKQQGIVWMLKFKRACPGYSS